MKKAITSNDSLKDIVVKALKKQFKATKITNLYLDKRKDIDGDLGIDGTAGYHYTIYADIYKGIKINKFGNRVYNYLGNYSLNINNLLSFNTLDEKKYYFPNFIPNVISHCRNYAFGEREKEEKERENA